MGNTPLWTLKRDRKKPNNSKEMRGSNRSIAFQNIPNQHSGVLHFGRVAIGPLGTHKGLALSQLLQPFAHKHPELEGHLMLPYKYWIHLEADRDAILSSKMASVLFCFTVGTVLQNGLALKWEEPPV